MSQCIALVVAAGRGHRAGDGAPKQYRSILGRSVLRRAVEPFLAHPGVDTVRPVIHPDDRELFDAATTGLDLLEPVSGGASRRESVRLGLESLTELDPGKVLIHDAARPFIDAGMITRVLEALEKSPGAIPALPVNDTLKRGTGGKITGTVDRAGLWRAQTPQGFRFDGILSAHRQAHSRVGGAPDGGVELTDDAAVAEKAGLAVALVPGSEENVKLTSEDDLQRAGDRLGAATVRTGFGFDVHRFGAGDHVMLGGVAIPFEAGLEGHSDADVALHALTDALLGAIGAGDIGAHFPPTQAEWKGAASDIFLRKAGDLVAGRGGGIANLDLTVICEKPRIGPHRAAMVARVAEILGLDESQVNVKATTTEGLGFTGRGEGIAAQAVATVLLNNN